ncbi:MAG: hypothetical protein WBG43_07030 [Marinifilaceae bacterium]
MICSYIKDNKQDIAFIVLHAEQVYSVIYDRIKPYTSELAILGDGVFNDKKIGNYINVPIFTKTLTPTTLRRVKEFVEKEESLPKKIYLNFADIEKCQKNCNSYFIELVASIENKNSVLKIINLSLEKSDFTDFLLRYYSGNKVSREEELIEDQKKLERNLRLLAFKDGLEDVEKLKVHSSSSVYLNKYFNLKKFIGNNKFVYLCIYRIAKKMVSDSQNRDWKLTSNLISNTVLCCQTLGGSFIASTLSDLLDIDMFSIDHLGPINKLYNQKYIDVIDTTKSYIIVSDVICLGTEVKIAQNIIGYCGGRCLGNVALLRIETIDQKDYTSKDVEQLYKIDKTNHEEFDYKILTAFNKDE